MAKRVSPKTCTLSNKPKSRGTRSDRRKIHIYENSNITYSIYDLQLVSNDQSLAKVIISFHIQEKNQAEIMELKVTNYFLPIMESALSLSS